MILYVIHRIGEVVGDSDLDHYDAFSNKKDAIKKFEEYAIEYCRNGSIDCSISIELQKIKLADLSKKRLAIALLSQTGWIAVSETYAIHTNMDKCGKCECCKEEREVSNG